jgi:hypothetical protein
MLTDGIKAVMPDGTPADCVRVLMWKAYNKATQKEPRLEVKDEKKAYEVFRGYFHQAIIIERRYSDYDELCRRLDEKIKSIVVQWKPEKGEQGQ